jgi:hypothetical protein
LPQPFNLSKLNSRPIEKRRNAFQLHAKTHYFFDNIESILKEGADPKKPVIKKPTILSESQAMVNQHSGDCEKKDN